MKLICCKCGKEYTPGPDSTINFCKKCCHSIHDSYSDLIECIDDQDNRDLKPQEHH